MLKVQDKPIKKGGKYGAEKSMDNEGNSFRSKLELYCSNKLKENDIEFEYEPMSFIL